MEKSRIPILFYSSRSTFKYGSFLHLTECWEVVVENPQFSHIVSYSLCEIQDLVSIVYINFLKRKNDLYKKFGS